LVGSPHHLIIQPLRVPVTSSAPAPPPARRRLPEVRMPKQRIAAAWRPHVPKVNRGRVDQSLIRSTRLVTKPAWKRLSSERPGYPGYEVRSARMSSPRSSDTVRRPWSQQPVLARFHWNSSSGNAARRSDLVVNVSSRPYGAKTFVYYNAGRGLGQTPLSVQFDHPGRHRLDFYTPSLRRHLTKIVQVTGRGRQLVSVTMAPSRELARLER